MSVYFFDPMDVWLFRDGRPFNAAGDHRAESLFPPAPSVLQGAIRTHYLSLKHSQIDWQKRAESIAAVVGTADDYGTLRVRGPFLAKRDAHADQAEIYLPRPANLLTLKDGRDVFVTPHAWPEGVTTSSRFKKQALAVWPPAQVGKPKAERAEWFTLADLDAVFTNKSSSGLGLPHKSLFARETRPGIGRELAQRTVREGHLYEAEFVRTAEGVGLAAEISGYADWPPHGVVHLGGEQHAAGYHPVTCDHWLPAPPHSLAKPFFVYFATPAYFAHGWKPATWESFFEGDVEVECAALGRYQSFGGFDLSREAGDARAHKPARRFVPAGSVYFFKPVNGSVQLRSNLIQNAFTEIGAEIGFGQVILKEWN